MSTTTITESAIIASYNRGPLSTVFIPPPSCLSTLTYGVHMYFGHDGLQYYDSACYPKSRSSTYTIIADNGNWNQYYYSPGQCPEAWAQATTFTTYFTNAADGGGQLLFPLGSDTTAVLCCPSGYVYWGDVGHQCATLVQSSSTELLYATTSISDNAIVLAKPTTTTLTSSYMILGDGIPIWWQSSDRSAFATPLQTTTSPPPTASYSTSLTFATSTSSPPLATSYESSGLSSGAKVAIGIAAGVLLTAMILGTFFYLRRRRMARGRQNTFGEGVRYPNHKGELATDGAISKVEPSPARQREEAVRQEPYELFDHQR